MKTKIRKMLRQGRIWVLIICVLLALLAINPSLDTKGIVVNSVEKDSLASQAGMQTPNANTGLRDREIITSFNGKSINTLKDFTEAIQIIPKGTFRIRTSRQEYVLFNNNTNASLGLVVGKVPATNLRKGLDLQGGTRVMLKPEGVATDAEIKDIIAVMENRLNVYGLADVSIKPASDLEGNKYILVEIAGATPEEVRELVGKQGVFEARIGNQTVFEGGEKDIKYVCRESGTCSRITECTESQNSRYGCRFEFQISISPESAKRHAGITKNLDINATQYGKVLSKTIDFYLDGKEVDRLNIDADLKGQEAKDILITGPGFGRDQNEAIQDAINNRNKLQTILITGSLPTKMEIMKLDSISPNLGEEFLKNTILVCLLAVLTVLIVIFIRYRTLKIVVPIAINLLAELTITLGLAALFRYNLDLAGIAGLIAAIGTGVDDVVVITDEVRAGEKEGGSLKGRIKKAFFVILAAYATTVAAMLPLLKAGAGLLVGFAVVTIAGVTVGVLITRPAFGAMIRTLME